MDLQVVVWLLYCFLLPTVLLAGKAALIASALDPRHKHLRFVDQQALRLDIREKLTELYNGVVLEHLGNQCSTKWIATLTSHAFHLMTTPCYGGKHICILARQYFQQRGFFQLLDCCWL